MVGRVGVAAGADCGPLPARRSPLALLQRFLLSRQSDRENAALAKNADRIFDLTRAFAAERGAVMQVIFLVYPDECRARSFDFDLTLLKTTFETLMPYCPEDKRWRACGSRRTVT